MKLQYRSLWLVLCFAVISGCAAPTAQPTPTSAPTQAEPTALPPTAEPSPTLAPTPDYPPEGTGPDLFPQGYNPLTGLKASDPGLLNRRPVIVKVQNIPREDRPQWGLSSADLVFEYYTERGSTRFAAIFYGEDAEMVGPVRSARNFDLSLLQMFKGILVFGGAFEGTFSRLVNNAGNQLVVESQYSCPALCRYDPRGKNYLMANTAALANFLKQARLDNSAQDLTGLHFNALVPEGGQPVNRVYVRFSAAIYNRWDWYPEVGRWLRFSDTQNDLDGNNEVYAPLTDRANGGQIGADTLVILLAPYKAEIITADSEVWDIPLRGQGDGYAFRDGQAFAIKWQRDSAGSIVRLTATDGSPFPLKPGKTWFEVLGQSSKVAPGSPDWRFTFSTP